MTTRKHFPEGCIDCSDPKTQSRCICPIHCSKPMTLPEIKLKKELRRIANTLIGWNSRYGLHISDGVDSCSGEDKEEMEKAKQYIAKRVKKLLSEALEAQEKRIEEIIKGMKIKDRCDFTYNEALTDILSKLKEV